MELQDRVDKIQKELESLGSGKKEILRHVTEQIEKLSQQIYGMMGTEASEGSFQILKQPGRKSPFATLVKGSNSLNNFVMKTLKLDFPWFDGNDDPSICICKVEKYFILHEIVEFDKVTLASFYLEEDSLLWFQTQELLYVT